MIHDCTTIIQKWKEVFKNFLNFRLNLDKIENFRQYKEN